MKNNNNGNNNNNNGKGNQSSGSNNGNWRQRTREVASSGKIEEVEEESTWSSFAAIDVTNGKSTETANAAAHVYGSILFDSGCSTHMTPMGDQLQNTRRIPTQTIQAANAGTFTSNIAGTLHLDLPMGNLTLQNTLLCPNMPNTLISLGRLDDAGFKIGITNNVMMICDKQGELIGRIPKVGGLYQIPASDFAMAATEWIVSLYEVHCMCGHQNYGYLKLMFQKNQVKGIKLDPKRMEEPECRACKMAKASRKPIIQIHQTPRAQKFRDRFFMDLWGPASTRTINHAEYAQTILDNATDWLVEPLLKTKDEAFTQYIILQTGLTAQFGITVKILHSDQGGEFLSGEFMAYLEHIGTKRELTVHDTSEYNG